MTKAKDCKQIDEALTEALKLLIEAQKVGGRLMDHIMPGWPSDSAAMDASQLDIKIDSFMEKHKGRVDAIRVPEPEKVYEGPDFRSLVETCMSDEGISKGKAISKIAKSYREAFASYVKELREATAHDKG